MAENKKLNPQDADVRVILHTPDDSYSEEDKMFMDLDNLAKQGIDPNNDDEVMTSKVPMTSRAMKGRLDVVPENKIIGAVTNMFGAIGDALDSIEVAKRLGNLINYEQRSIPVPTNLNDLITRTEITPDMEKTAFEKAVNARYRIDFNKMETTDVNLKTLLEAVDLPLSELLGFGAAERVSKELATGFTPEKEDVADVLLSATGVPAAAVGVAKGTKKVAKTLQPKVLEFVEEGIDAFEDFFGMKQFAVPKDKKGVAPRKKPNASFTGTLSEFDETAAETKPGFVKDRSVKGNIYRTNLITNDPDNPNPILRNLWKWVTPVDDYKNARQIISIQGRVKGKSDDHFFTLQANFPTGAKLANYVRKEPPNLRPTTQGELQFGKQVGSIRVGQQKNAKTHPVYDEITLINNVPIKQIIAEERTIIPAPKKLFRDKKTKEPKAVMGLNQLPREFDTGEYIDPVDKKIITNQFIQNGTVKIKKDVDVFDQPNNQPPKTEVSKNVTQTTTNDVVNNNEKMIGTAIPKKVKRDVVNVNNNADFENFANMEKKIIQNVKLMSLSPSIKNVAQTKEGAEQIVELLKDNIRFIYNNASEAIKVGAKEWYVGANKIAKQMAEKYNLNDAQTSAILAALSPQKDWNQNVSLAERVAKILTYDVDIKVDNKVLKKVKELYNPNEDIYYVINYGTKKQYYNSKKAKGTLEKKISFAIKNLSLEDVDKMKFPQLTPEQEARRKIALKALILRAIDETNYDRSFKKINYDGSYGDTVITKTGETDTAAWQDYDSIGKAVKIFEDGSIKNINVSVGNGHKVRSFYNNIVNPDADNIVTVDTHAVAAAQLRPLGAKDLEPSNAFGTHNKKELLQDERLKKLGIGDMTGPAGNDTIGEYGTYSFYKKAYDEVAKEFGLKSRELQSIVWEGVREFFPDTFKSTQNKKTIDNIWLDWKAGNISVEEARKQITDFRNKNVGGVNE